MPAVWVETTELPITALAKFPGNARRGNVAEIRKSIRRNGQYRAIVVRRHDGEHTILAGNHTAIALEAEGHHIARCEVIECDDREARRINLADNRLSDKAMDDGDALAELLSYLDEDYDGTGWSADEVEKLITPPDRGQDPGDLHVWGIIAECDTEDQQTELLEQLQHQGWRVRPLA